MVRNILKRNRLSYREESQRVGPSMEPLDFLSVEGTGTSTQLAFDRIHHVVHVSLEEVEREFLRIFEQLEPESNVTDQSINEANGDIRKWLSTARSIVDAQRDMLVRQIRIKMELVFIQGLIQIPHDDAPVKKWENLVARAVKREEPSVSEYNYNELREGKERRKRVQHWQEQTDGWLETICRNSVSEVIEEMEDEVKAFITSWEEVTVGLRRRASLGGGLFREVYDRELWTFESEDPTVRNLQRGEQARAIGLGILERFQPSTSDYVKVAETVKASLGGLPIYGINRVSVEEIEHQFSQAIAKKIQETQSLGMGFLSYLSNGANFGEELGELLAEMQRGTTAMEQKLWRVGEVGVGHVDSASGVGITSSNVHDLVLRGLGGGRKFAAVEGHPGDNHKFDVQMSIVGAPASDMSLWREMVAAWYAWHFAENRGSSNSEGEWLEHVKAECWKLYPDIGTDSGVRNAIIELIDEDLKVLWRAKEGLAPRVANGLPEDQALLHGLWRELGIIADGTVAEV